MRLHDKKHTDKVRQCSCCICGDNTSTEVAHIRMADGRIGKPSTGVGIKPDDRYVVPLCGKHHREQHSMSERAFWEKLAMDPILIALYLYSCKTVEEMEEIITWHNMKFIPIP